MKNLVLLIVAISAYSAMADEIKGVVTLQSSNCPISNLVVEIDPAIGSSQPKVVTTTDQTGNFTARVTSGRYLLVIYQQGTKVYQSELIVQGTTNQSIVLAPSGPVSSCNLPNAAKARLAMKGIEIKHNGSPFFSNSWHFEIFLNDVKITGVPEHVFDKREKWWPAAEWQPVTVSAVGKLVVRIKGYQGGKKTADGSSEYVFGGGTAEDLNVEVSCDYKSHGDFAFHFLVEKIPPS